MSDSDEWTLSINKDYAAKYEHAKSKQELAKLKEKYKDVDENRLEKILERKKKYNVPDDGSYALDASESDSETSESEDEVGELITPQLDAQILQTIAAIRKKDPKIYEDTQFFQEEKVEERVKEKGAKEMKLKDYHRALILENGGVVDEEEELSKIKVMSHVQEQEELRKSLKQAAHASDDETEEALFMKRSKTKDELDAEEADYRQFLLESLSKGGQDEFERWKNHKNNPNVDKDESFLMEYILNRGWINKAKHAIPSYEDVVADLSEDEEQVEEAEQFESEYNFRFEEPGSNRVVTHARTIPDSVRRTESKRKSQRLSKAERKEEEKRQKQEELKRLKNLKKKEIYDKLKTIQEITGNDAVGVDDVDLEGDFDPDQYDQKMQKMFSDDYYNGGDDEKPHFEDDIDITDLLPSLEGKKKKKKKVEVVEEEVEEEEEIIMDADYLPGGEFYGQTPPQLKGKKKTKTTKDKRLAKREFDDYLDQFYQLDYEDMIGDLPTRFKYKQVKPATYGLTAAEILMADDKDLNRHVSLKKMAPYRPKDVEKVDVFKYSQRERVHKFRKQLYKKTELGDGAERRIKTKKRKVSEES